MKKWLAVFVVLLVLGLGFFYFSIPNKLSLNEKTAFEVNTKAFARAFFTKATWSKWWPEAQGKNSSAGGGLRYKGNVYTVVKQTLSTLSVSIKNGTDSILTDLVVIPLTIDSVELNWVGTVQAEGHTVSRMKVNRWTKQVSADIKTLLQTMQPYYRNEANLYPLEIREETVVDSTLVFTSQTVVAYPTTATVYNQIDMLKSFAQNRGARQTGLPMLDIQPRPDNRFLMKVALPVDKKLNDEGDIRYRWMLGGGRILVTEVTGGPGTISNAFATMDQYVEDHHRTAPAIPFQSLVTDRRAEPDTNKWITKLYWPVM